LTGFPAAAYTESTGAAGHHQGRCPVKEAREGVRRGLRRVQPGVWQVVARLKVGGRVMHRQRTISGTRQDAERVREELRREIREGRPSGSLTASEVQNFGQVIDLYRHTLEDTGRHVEYGRLGKLKRELGGAPLPGFGDRFEEWLRAYRVSPIVFTRKGREGRTVRQARGKPTPAAVNRMIAYVRAAFNLAVQLGKVAVNPITAGRFPKAREVPRDRYLSDVERRRLFNAIDQHAPHIEPIVRFALQVPSRLAELVNMRTEDLDLVNQCIRVHRGTTKNKRGIWKPVPPDMVGYFRSLPAGCEYVFYRKTGAGYRSLGDFRASWQHCLEVAGIVDYRFHDTRHNAATDLVDNGTPERAVMEVAGWRTNMLSTYYSSDSKRALSLVRFAPRSEGPMKVGDTKAG